MDTDSSLAHCGSLIFNAAQQQVLTVPLPFPSLPIPSSSIAVPMSVLLLLLLLPLLSASCVGYII